MSGLYKPTDTLEFAAMFSAARTGKTGLSVNVYVNGPSGNLIGPVAATEVDSVNQPGLYRYRYVPGGTLPDGEYYGEFRTTDATVDIQQLIDGCSVRAWIADIDAAISTRAAAGVSVTVTSPVATTLAISLEQGLDYYNDDGSAISFTITAPYSLTGATVVLQFAGLSVTGVVTSSTQMYFEIAKTLLASTGPGTYLYEVEATLADGHKVVPIQGSVTVSANRS